jgi:hypothetical protein
LDEGVELENIQKNPKKGKGTQRNAFNQAKSVAHKSVALNAPIDTGNVRTELNSCGRDKRAHDENAALYASKTAAGKDPSYSTAKTDADVSFSAAITYAALIHIEGFSASDGVAGCKGHVREGGRSSSKRVRR